MANANPNRLGQVKNTGDDKALFMKQYAGEVLTSFVEEYKLAGKVTERNIQHGKSASFPAIGTIGSEYHVPGTEITGMNVQHGEVIVNLDPMLISHVFIPNIDEAMNHYDVRSEYTKKQGAELAKQRQLNELRCAILSARKTTGPVDGIPGGMIITATDMATNAQKLADAIRAARQNFDEKGVPDEEITAAVKPVQWYALTQLKDLVNRDFNPQSADSLKDAVIYSIARIPLLKTNHMPNKDDTANASLVQSRRADFSKTISVVFHKSAVATLKLLDLAVEDAYDVRRQGTLMLSKFALGHDPLRSDGSVEIAVA
ncbi:capsid protein [Dyella marensis]|uniref:phage capsid protein n=1 Tax=Dyella marensis TaxID=500610 RepID=UPI0031CF7328